MSNGTGRRSSVDIRDQAPHRGRPESSRIDAQSGCEQMCRPDGPVQLLLRQVINQLPPMLPQRQCTATTKKHRHDKQISFCVMTSRFLSASRQADSFLRHFFCVTTSRFPPASRQADFSCVTTSRFLSCVTTSRFLSASRQADVCCVTTSRFFPASRQTDFFCVTTDLHRYNGTSVHWHTGTVLTNHRSRRVSRSVNKLVVSS